MKFESILFYQTTAQCENTTTSKVARIHARVKDMAAVFCCHRVVEKEFLIFSLVKVSHS